METKRHASSGHLHSVTGSKTFDLGLADGYCRVSGFFGLLRASDIYELFSFHDFVCFRAFIGFRYFRAFSGIENLSSIFGSRVYSGRAKGFFGLRVFSSFGYFGVLAFFWGSGFHEIRSKVPLPTKLRQFQRYLFPQKMSEEKCPGAQFSISTNLRHPFRSLCSLIDVKKVLVTFEVIYEVINLELWSLRNP